jgi:folate-binding protein YgfZ
MSDLKSGYDALRQSAGVLDLSSRGRLCLTGSDRANFLHGQVTNDVKRLQVGEGCYAALVTAKGKMESDLNIYLLQDEILLDFEAGLTSKIAARLEKYVIAEDVQVVDVQPLYGMLTIQGPGGANLLAKLYPAVEVPAEPFKFVTAAKGAAGEIYLINRPRIGSNGFDLFIPVDALADVAKELIGAGASSVSEDAMEVARIEAAVPRYSVDMDESNLAPECVAAAGAISYSKGCYIGQEVIARIRTYGQVAKSLRRLTGAPVSTRVPARGETLRYGEKEVGHLTSVAQSPETGRIHALGYLRKEVPAEASVVCVVDGLALEVRPL